MFDKISLPFVLFFYLTFIIYSQQVSDFSYVEKYRNKRVDYPVRFTYINKLTNWWPPEATLAQMGVPQYSKPHSYNYIALAFWTCQNGSIDAAKLWDDPLTYFGENLGKTKSSIQKFLKQKYNNRGISILLSAFGPSQLPTTIGLDPIMCAQKLGLQIKSNNFDGVDIDYEDNQAMISGKGQQWLIAFTTQLRKQIPYHILTHSPQASYFNSSKPGGDYRRVHNQVGRLIDFYNIQYYNQLNSTYETYQSLFIHAENHSPQTSVLELHIIVGIPMEMIVVGKPASLNDVDNTGFVQFSNLIEFFVRANNQIAWNTGFMIWQYFSDRNGTISNQFTKVMQSLNTK